MLQNNLARLLIFAPVLIYCAQLGPDLDIVKKEEIRRTLQFKNPNAAKHVLVDNVSGSIRVVGDNIRDVQLVVHKTLRAASESKLQEAREQVVLDIAEEEDAVKLYVDGPFRRSNGEVNYRGWRYYGYEVNWDFELRVPREASLYLRAINDGEIEVKNVAGDFDIKNVNGGVNLSEIAGAGSVYALNGGVKVLFQQNPKAESYFGSLNGDVEIIFREGLAAEAGFKTFNGEIYTDFEVTYLANKSPTSKRKHGRYIYKSDEFSRVRIGSGGPQLTFDAFNGDIRMLKRE
ncbi:hypothetical protein EDS67_02375 [candidate division KSB1 bacterium]|nr:MAG: hypothetical protein EDS67_02375 [candidate division KSB1 bacterium]MCE7941876.1 hypothetical protein [Chlorobi bacterium CHB1]MDL1877787.1 hypothetical protein [Cytophagia bacterium CHB2]